MRPKGASLWTVLAVHLSPPWQVVKGLFKDSYAFDKRIGNAVSAKLKQQLTNFKKKLPIILLLGNKSMRPRHWAKIFQVTGFVGGNAFSMSDLRNAGIFETKYRDVVEEESGKASGEAMLEASLEEAEHGWEETEFTVLNYREQKNALIIGGLDEVLQQLEDDLVALQTMLGSRYIPDVKQMVELQYKKPNLLSETLDEWVSCLETIFSAEDIQKQLPDESQRFSAIDKNFKQLMRRTGKYPLVMEAIEQGRKTLVMLQHSNDGLEAIQKSLEEYLETKRSAFPRFYFLSNDELLEILSQTRDPRAVQVRGCTAVRLSRGATVGGGVVRCATWVTATASVHGR